MATLEEKLDKQVNALMRATQFLLVDVSNDSSIEFRACEIVDDGQAAILRLSAGHAAYRIATWCLVPFAIEVASERDAHCLRMAKRNARSPERLTSLRRSRPVIVNQQGKVCDRFSTYISLFFRLDDGRRAEIEVDTLHSYFEPAALLWRAYTAPSLSKPSEFRAYDLKAYHEGTKITINEAIFKRRSYIANVRWFGAERGLLISTSGIDRYVVPEDFLTALLHEDDASHSALDTQKRIRRCTRDIKAHALDVEYGRRDIRRIGLAELLGRCDYRSSTFVLPKTLYTPNVHAFYEARTKEQRTTRLSRALFPW